MRGSGFTIRPAPRLRLLPRKSTYKVSSAERAKRQCASWPCHWKMSRSSPQWANAPSNARKQSRLFSTGERVARDSFCRLVHLDSWNTRLHSEPTGKATFEQEGAEC